MFQHKNGIYANTSFQVIQRHYRKIIFILYLTSEKSIMFLDSVNIKSTNSFKKCNTVLQVLSMFEKTDYINTRV